MRVRELDAVEPRGLAVRTSGSSWAPRLAIGSRVASRLARRCTLAPPQPAAALARTRGALSRPHNWVQLAKFCAVGASGYVVNLAVYTLLLKGAGVHYLPAATCSFLVAVTNNYTWNRLWTFRGQRGHVALPGACASSSSRWSRSRRTCSPARARRARPGKVLAQAIAIVLVTPLNFVGNKLWSFRTRS